MSSETLARVMKAVKKPPQLDALRVYIPPVVRIDG